MRVCVIVSGCNINTMLTKLATALLVVSLAQAGGFSCNAVCLSRVASIVSVAANGKSIMAGIKKIRPKKAKRT